MRTFHDRLDEMMRHYSSHAREYRTGEYWNRIARQVYKQTQVCEGGVLSPEWYMASTFSGSALNSVSPLADRETGSWKYRSFGRLLSALYRFSLYSAPFNPLWRAGLNGRYLGSVLGSARINYEVLVHYAYETFRSHIEHFDIRSPELFGVDLVAVSADRKLAYKTVRDFNIFLRIKDLVDTRGRRVVEIGPGIGEMARLFWTTGTCTKYVLVDIPPTLAFSQEFIAASASPERVDFFDPRRTKVNFTNDKTFYFLTPDQIGMVPAFDLGINIASFGEMEPDIVGRYVNSLKNSGFEEFVSINQRLKKTGNDWAFGEKEYAQMFAPEYGIRAKYSFRSNAPLMHLPADQPNVQGYQVLHFKKSAG